MCLALVSAVFGLGVAQAVPTERRSGWIAFIRNYTKEPEHPTDTSGPDTVQIQTTTIICPGEILTGRYLVNVVVHAM